MLKSIRILNKPNLVKNFQKLSISTNQEILIYRAGLFENEKQRQLKEIERIEKIQVNVIENNKEHKLVMNKNISTPTNCAMHISELLVKRSALAKVNDKLWDMNRPLENDCTITFMHFKDQKPYLANMAYWRSCSFLLGYLLETSFKNNYKVDLCSFPGPDPRTGSFVYDAQLNIPNWKPTREELRCMSISAIKMIRKNLSFERLQISKNLAEEMFKYNSFKSQQISRMISKEDDKLTVYKVGDYVDISQGPMIANTGLIGRFEITGVFEMETKSYGKIQRIQGLSIPYQLNLHDWTFDLLAQRASSLNASPEPTLAHA